MQRQCKASIVAYFKVFPQFLKSGNGLFSKLTVYYLDLDARGSIPCKDIDPSQHQTQGVPRAVFLEVVGGEWGWKR